MLDSAKSYLRNVLATRQPVIEAGVPVIGLGPSCTAVFRDEMVELLDGNEDAKRLHDQAFYFSESLSKHADGRRPPKVGVDRRACRGRRGFGRGFAHPVTRPVPGPHKRRQR
jgi:Fe-S oxidoreductase